MGNNKYSLQERCVLFLILQEFKKTPPATHLFTKLLPLSSRIFLRMISMRVVAKDSN